jgi:hypothetical protein
MYEFEPEDFYEPSEFDILFHQLKQSLLKSVKDEYVVEMNKLKKENEKLQEVKKNFDQIKKEYENKKRQLDFEYQDMKGKARRERIRELMKGLEVELFTVGSRSKSSPKCSKCDEKRRIYYKTPSGKETYETCECDTKIHIYEPIQTMMSSFSIRDGKGSAWYKVVDGDRYDGYLSYYEDSISGRDLITNEEQFKDIGWAYRVLFANREIAQKYCDLKNGEQEVKKNVALKRKL